jgi:hypothetical protein
MTTIAPVRREVLVSATPLHAFNVWTQQLDAWWPFATHSVHGSESTAAFVDGVLIETATDGSTCIWGTVTTWNPGVRLAMTWHPGHAEDASTTVDVSFAAEPDGRTRVTLTHTGWENRADAVAARDNYETGWPPVLESFANLVSEVSA